MKNFTRLLVLGLLMLAGIAGRAETWPDGLGTTRFISPPYNGDDPVAYGENPDFVAPPVNDDCASATNLTPGASCVATAGTNVEATQSIAAITCGIFTSSSALDVWYKFTATATTHVITVVGAGTFDAIIDVRSGACNGVNIGCADATTAGGTETVTVGGLTVGNVYLVRVYGWAGGTGTFSICVAGAAAGPANDDCANAINLTSSVSCVATAGTNVNATQSIAPITCATFTSSSALDVWYKFTAVATTQTVTVVGGSTLDAIIDVRSGACNGANIGCADATVTGGTEVATVSGLTVGTVYLVRVYGWAGGTGTFTICVTGAAAAAPANDDCANAVTLTPGASCTPTNGTTVGGTQTIAAITCASFTGTADDDVWYKFTATSANQTVTVVGSAGFDAVVDVRSGACNGTNIACADATVSGGTETVALSGLTVGTTYLVRVYSFGSLASNQGTFTICVTTPAPANDNCASAVTLTPAAVCSPTSGTTVGATQTIAAITCATFTGTADDDVWYQFTATSTNHNVTVVGGAGFDAVVDVRTGACNGTNIACADATVSGGTETVTLSGLTVGATYLVRVYSFGSLAGNQGTFTICVTTPAPPVPANNECATATTLTPAIGCNPTSGTTVGATQSIPAITCATFTGTADDDVWYQFTATNVNHTVTVVGGAGFDAVVDVRSGGCNGSNIGCSDGTTGGGTESVVLSGLTIGTTYLVRVYSFGSLAGNQGTFTICVTLPATVANDDCSAAVTLTPGATCVPTSGTTINATQSVGPAVCSGFAAAQAFDVWYKFTAAAPTQIVTVDGAANMDAVVEVRTGACNGTALTCSDQTTADGIESITLTGLTVGTTYLVRVYDFFSNGGDFTICITTPAPGCLANPTSPTNGQTGVCPGPVTLSWPAEGAATTYDVYFGTTAVPPFVANVSTTTYAAGTLSAGTYFWQIRPRNSTGVASGCAIWTFTVGDNVAPVITCPASVTVSNTPGLCSAVVTYGSIGATDNCSAPAITLVSGQISGTSFAVGTTVITYRATDAAGNSSTCSFSVKVNDTQAPAITCPASVTVSNTPGLCSAVVTYGSIGATDNCTAPAITLVSGQISGTSFAVGTTAITYRATDAAGNSSTCSFTVRVNDTQAPVITCPANLTLANTPGLCSRVVAYTTPVGTDNCSAVTSQINGLPSASAFPVGTTTNIFQAVDPSNNATTCQFQVVINDTEPPKITCEPNRQVLTDGFSCEATNVNLGALPQQTDNCGIGAAATNNAPAVYPIGTTTVVWIAKDVNGNTASCTQQVTVKDLQTPVIQCPPTVHATANAANGTCSAIVDFTVNAYDNCPGLILSYNYPPLSEFPLNYTLVQATATDASGNVNACSFLVIVNPDVEVCNGIDDDCDGLTDESDDWVDVGREEASDGVAGEQYGTSIDLDGTYAVVGSKDKNQGGATPGAAYILHRNGPGNWEQVLKLSPNGLDAGDRFGDAVAIDQSWVAVGAPGDDDVADNAGAVYLFQQSANDPSQWIQTLKLTLPAGTLNDNLGLGLALQGDYLLAGAVNDDQAATDAGAVYVFGRNQGGANNWGLVKKLTAPAGATGDLFGANLDYDGTEAIVSATGDDQKGDGAGAAYIFGRNTGGVNNWGLQAKVTASTGKAGDDFGADVAISGDFALVGADQNDDKAPNAGRAYLFFRNQNSQINSWGQYQALLDINGKTDDNFGAAVGIDGNVAVVGSPGTDFQIYAQNPGKAVVYQYFDGTWIKVDELTDGPSHNKNDRFGTEAAVSGQTILIGVPFDNLGPGGSSVDQGSVSFFEGLCVSDRAEFTEEADVETPALLTMQCAPIPFSDRLTIRVAGADIAAHISILNNLGQEVAVVYDGLLAQQGTQVDWDAARFASGLYFVRLRTAEGIQTQTVSLVRR